MSTNERVFYSLHALERMIERGVGKDTVQSILDEPEYTYARISTDVNGRVYVGEDWVVVTEDPHGDRERRVLTVTPRENGKQESRPLKS